MPLLPSPSISEASAAPQGIVCPTPTRLQEAAPIISSPRIVSRPSQRAQSPPPLHIPTAMPLLAAPTRLLSPIRIGSRRDLALCRATSPSPCSPTSPKPKRRRLSRSTRHTRCPGDFISRRPTISSVFDEYPVINMLDVHLAEPTSPCPSSGIPLNLSQLPVSQPKDQSATGPIRSRKSSLRTAPFPPESIQHRDQTPSRSSTPDLSPSLTASTSPGTPPPLSTPLPPALVPFPSRGSVTLPFNRPLDDEIPRTPSPRARVLPNAPHFRNLMPVPVEITPTTPRAKEPVWWSQLDDSPFSQ